MRITIDRTRFSSTTCFVVVRNKHGRIHVHMAGKNSALCVYVFEEEKRCRFALDPGRISTDIKISNFFDKIINCTLMLLISGGGDIFCRC